MAEPSTERALSAAKEAELREALLRVYPPGFLQTKGGEETIEVEVHTRSFWFRKRYVPWLMSHIDLANARVLEIGAGTGTSAVPLAEKGALIDSIDIDATSLSIARIRSELHGLADKVCFKVGNAKDIASLFPQATYGLIVYFAALEHMTHAERLETLRSAWSMLRPGGLLAAVDTPNRLWYFDNHTSMSDFFSLASGRNRDPICESHIS